MQVCKNPQCKAKHYELAFVCSNCNQELPVAKERKSFMDVYYVVGNSSINTKRITDKFLNANVDQYGFVELLKNGTEPVTYFKKSDGSFRICK